MFMNLGFAGRTWMKLENFFSLLIVLLGSIGMDFIFRIFSPANIAYWLFLRLGIRDFFFLFTSFHENYALNDNNLVIKRVKSEIKLKFCILMHIKSYDFTEIKKIVKVWYIKKEYSKFQVENHTISFY